jgi:hypothetical protein
MKASGNLGGDRMTVFGARARLGTLVLAAAALGGAALAAPKSEGRAAELQKLADCRKVPESAARLACYDAAAAEIDTAEAKGDIVVVDRDQVRRQTFGFSLPSIPLFERGDAPAAVDRITGKVTAAHQSRDGAWVLELEDGAIWAQADSEPVPRGVKTGSTAEIRKSAFGGYFINVDKQRAFRATRSR